MKILAIITIIGMMILAGCATVQTDTIQEKVNAPAEANVEIVSAQFSPAEVTIKAGGSVTWISRDDQEHKIVFEDSESRSLEKGEQYIKTFNKKGTYEYVSVNTGAIGTVIVK